MIGRCLHYLGAAAVYQTAFAVIIAASGAYAQAQEPTAAPQPPQPIVIAYVGFDTVPAPSQTRRADQPSPPAPAFRHTFGAERRTAPARPQLSTELEPIDADVVLATGLFSLAHARAVFPARSWRIVLARSTVTASAITTVSPGASKPFAVIALRYRSDLRIAPDAAIDELPPQSLAASEATPQPMTLARLIVAGRPLWLAAVDLSACASPCRPREALTQWVVRRRVAGDAVFIAGLYPDDLDADPPLRDLSPQTPTASEPLTVALAAGSDYAVLAGGTRTPNSACAGRRLRIERPATADFELPLRGHVTASPTCKLTVELRPRFAGRQ